MSTGAHVTRDYVWIKGKIGLHPEPEPPAPASRWRWDGNHFRCIRCDTMAGLDHQPTCACHPLLQAPPVGEGIRHATGPHQAMESIAVDLEHLASLIRSNGARVVYAMGPGGIAPPWIHREGNHVEIRINDGTNVRIHVTGRP